MPMNPDGGYIKLYRSILDWEWYTDVNTYRLFLHLLLKANYEPKKWRGRVVERGQVVTGRLALAQELKISERAVRTALEHLKSTGEVTVESTSKYSVITIVNYAKYQDRPDATDQQTDQRPVTQPTSERPTNDQQTTTTKEIKKERNEEGKKYNTPPTPPTGGSAKRNGGPVSMSDAKEYIATQFTSPEVQSAMLDFVESRRASKTPMTMKALVLNCNDLKKLATSADTQRKIIEQSIKRGYRGLFALDQGGGYARKPEADTRSKDYGGWER